MLERPRKSKTVLDLERRATATARARTQRYRARLQAGVVTAIVELDGDVLAMLVRTDWLAEKDSTDRRAIGRAEDNRCQVKVQTLSPTNN